MTKTERFELIADAVAGLSDKEAITYLTCYFDGYTDDELAHFCGYKDVATFEKVKPKTSKDAKDGAD